MKKLLLILAAVSQLFAISVKAQTSTSKSVGPFYTDSPLKNIKVKTANGTDTLLRWQDYITILKTRYPKSHIDSIVAGYIGITGVELLSNKTATKSSSTTTYPNWLGVTNALLGDTTHVRSASLINAKDRGVLPTNSAATNSTLLSALLGAYKEVYLPEGSYLVSDTVANNYLAHKLYGPGVLLKNITGGTQQINSYADNYPLMRGREYLFKFQSDILNKVATDTTSIFVKWSGDSTTAGVSAPGADPSTLFAQLCAKYGLRRIVSYNHGHGGMSMSDAKTYITVDTTKTSLLVLRWGINDPTLGHTPKQFAGYLRGYLATVRATKGVDKLSILLMTPNSTDDLSTGRDEKWYEQINAIVAKAAVDYQCAFFDTYAFYKDSRNAASWMDTPTADPTVHIHPLPVMNSALMSQVFEMLVPVALRSPILDESSTKRLPLFTDLPATYSTPLSLNRASSVNGWPIDGFVTTTKQADGYATQFIYSYASATPKLQYRSSNGTAWTSLIDIASGLVIDGTSGLISASSAPSAFAESFSIQRCTDAPYDGQLITFHQQQGVWLQMNTDYTNGKFEWRTNNGGNTGWSAWKLPLLFDAVISATDAAYVVSLPETFHKLPTITANRLVSVPTASSYTGRRFTIWVNNTSSSFGWSISGSNCKDNLGVTITALSNNGIYEFESDGTNWILKNGQPVFTQSNAVVASASANFNTSSRTVTSFTVGASDADFSVEATFNIISGSGTLAMSYSWTNESGTPQTDTFYNNGSSTSSFTSGCSRFCPVSIRCKSGTTISIDATASGTISFGVSGSIIKK